jgi:type I restriction enzyme S subunit
MENAEAPQQGTSTSINLTGQPVANSSPISHPGEWPVVRLADITLKIGSGATPRGGSENYLPERVNFALIRSQNVFDRRFDCAGLAFISDEQAQGLQNVIVQPDDLLLNITGDGITFARSCVVPEDVLPACVNQHVSIIRVDTSLADPGYVLAFLTHPGVKDYIESFNAGGSRRAITKGHIESFRLPLPPLSEQRKIAAVLGTLDDKIELNRKMNATLEAMARALFNSWFVDFDPVHAKAEGRSTGLPEHITALFSDSFEDSELGEIPTDWTVTTIGEVARVVGGSTPSTKEPTFWENGKHCWATPKDLSNLATPALLDTERKLTDAGLAQISSGLLPVGTLLLSSRAPIGYLAIAQVPVAVNQGFIAMLPGNGISNIFLLYWAESAHEVIISRANGSTFLEISKSNFRPIPLVLPPASLMNEFEHLARALYSRMVLNTHEVRELSMVRDALLPKLTSGELRIEVSKQEAGENA